MKTKFLLFFKKLFRLWNVGLLVVLFCMNLPVIAQTSSQENSPSAVNDVINSGGYGVWNNPDNAKSDDGAYSYNSFYNGKSDFLVAYNYKFSIPSGATITGIKVTVGRYGTEGTLIEDDFVKLRKNGSFVGDINYAVSGNWPSSESPIVYGGENDLWGTSWTPTDINNAGFGIGMAVNLASGSGVAYVDYIKIAVYYIPLDPLYCAGSAVVLYEANSTTNPYNALNAPDGAVATLLDQYGGLLLDLTGEVTPRPSGGHVTVRWRDGNGTDAGSPMAYYIYATTYSSSTGFDWSSPIYKYVTSPTLVYQDITVGENSRYLMFRLSTAGGVYPLDIDAVIYDCPCTGPTITSVTASAATICFGGSTTLAVTGDLCGADHWTWYKESCGGESIGTGSSISYTPDNTGALTYYVRAEGGSAGTEGTCSEVTVTVNPLLTPSVTIKSDDDDNIICEGTLVTFTATPSNTDGGTISYQWMYNGSPVGLDQDTYNNNGESDNGDRISCEINVTGGNCLTSNTAISEEITITVNPTGGTATTDTPSVCPGKTAVLTLTDYLGSIQWQYTDGISVPVDVIGGTGSTSAVYTTPPLTYDTYFVAKVTGGTCNPAYSNPVLITVASDCSGTNDCFEPNNTMSSSLFSIPLNYEITAKLANSKDVDWYRFDAQVDAKYTLNYSNSSGTTLPTVDLYGSNGRKLRSVDRAQPNSYNLLTGTYYIKVSAAGLKSSICYYLEVSNVGAIVGAISTAADETKSAKIEPTPDGIFRIWPNPTKNEFELYNGTETPVQVRVMDVSGRMIETIENVGIAQTVVFGSKYKPGIYFVETVENGTPKVFKLVKQ